MSQVFATDYVYKLAWRDLSNCAIVGVTPGFSYESTIIITEMNDCLLRRIPNVHLYDKMKPRELEIGDDAFATKLRRQNASIVILTNAERLNGKVTTNLIKNKAEWIYNETKMEFICIAATKNSCFLKPHTGMWRLLKTFYRQEKKKIWGGDYKVSLHADVESEDVEIEGRPIVVSNYGGAISDEKKVFSDIDRAFAWNIGAKFMTVNEFLNRTKKEKFIWNSLTIHPEQRGHYVEEVKKFRNKKIFQILYSYSAKKNYPFFIIFIYGAPCCGKTRLAKSIISKWRESKYDDTHAIVRLGSDEYTPVKLFNQYKKNIAQRITVILDNNCYNDVLRKKYFDEAQRYDVPVLFIEVDVSIKMAEIFNHARVEESSVELIPLVCQEEFSQYKAKMSPPNHDSPLVTSIKYIPEIESRPTVMHYMY